MSVLLIVGVVAFVIVGGLVVFCFCNAKRQVGIDRELEKITRTLTIADPSVAAIANRVLNRSVDALYKNREVRVTAINDSRHFGVAGSAEIQFAATLHCIMEGDKELMISSMMDTVKYRMFLGCLFAYLRRTKNIPEYLISEIQCDLVGLIPINHDSDIKNITDGLR